MNENAGVSKNSLQSSQTSPMSQFVLWQVKSVLEGKRVLCMPRKVLGLWFSNDGKQPIFM